MESASRLRSALLLAVAAAALGPACTRRPAATRGREAALAVLEGRVESAAGLPLDDGRLVLRWEEQGQGQGDGEDRVPAADQRLPPQGTFRVAGLPPGRYQLRVRAAGHAAARLSVELSAGETRPLTVRLERAETLRGRIVDRDGEPVPAARVLVFPLDDPAAPPREGASDADGRFAVAGLGRGPHRLIAEAVGFGSTEEASLPVPPPAGEAVVHMEAVGKSVTGQVLAAGAPAAGARVVIGGENLSPGREALARPDGRFRFQGIGPGVYALRASRAGEVSRASAEVVVDRSNVPTDPVRLDLGPGWIVAGRVVDDAGVPLPGSEVRIEAASGDDPLPEIARADSAGAFRAGPLPPGEFRLTPRRPGYIARRPRQLAVGPSAADRQLQLELVRGAEVAGRVVDARGAPIVDALVRCLTPGRAAELPVIVDRLPPAAEAAAMPSGSGHALGRGRSVLSDRGGRFRVADVLPGRFVLDVSRAGSVPHRSAPLRLEPGQRLDVGTVALADAVRVTGRVVDEDDAPVAAARIAIDGAAGIATDRPVVVLTDQAGQFTAAVAEGEHALAVSAAGMREQRTTLRASAAAPPPPLAVRLTRGGASPAR
jgi:protocatechuate 3,4-dioxygenase beta subunit